MGKVWTPRAVRFQELHRLLNRARAEQALWNEDPHKHGGPSAENIRSIHIMQWEAELKSFPKEYHDSVT